MIDATHNPRVNNGIKDRLMVSKEGKKPVVYRDKQGNIIAEPFYDAGTVLVNEDSSIGLSSGSSKKDLTVQQVLESHQIAIQDLQTQILPTPGDNPGQDSDNQDHVDVVVGDNVLYLEDVPGWDDSFLTSGTLQPVFEDEETGLHIDDEIHEYAILKEPADTEIDWDTQYRVANYKNPRFWIYFDPIEVSTIDFLPMPGVLESLDPRTDQEEVSANFPRKDIADMVPYDEVWTDTYKVGNLFYFWVGLENGNAGPVVALDSNGCPYIVDDVAAAEAEGVQMYQGYTEVIGTPVVLSGDHAAENFATYVGGNTVGVFKYSSYYYIYVDPQGLLGNYSENPHYDKVSTYSVATAGIKSGTTKYNMCYTTHVGPTGIWNTNPGGGWYSGQWVALKSNTSIDNEYSYFYAKRSYNKNLCYGMYGNPEPIDASTLPDVKQDVAELKPQVSSYLETFVDVNADYYSKADSFTELFQRAINTAADSGLKLVFPKNADMLVGARYIKEQDQNGEGDWVPTVSYNYAGWFPAFLYINKPVEIDLNGSTLRVATNWSHQYYMIDIAVTAPGTVIKNGSIIGDRDTHIRLPNRFAAGDRHDAEGNILIYTYASNTLLENLKLSDVRGDAITGIGWEYVPSSTGPYRKMTFGPKVETSGTYYGHYLQTASSAPSEYISLSDISSSAVTYGIKYWTPYRRTSSGEYVPTISENYIREFVADKLFMMCGPNVKLPDTSKRVNGTYRVEYYQKSGNTYQLLYTTNCRVRDRGFPVWGHPSIPEGLKPTHVKIAFNANASDLNDESIVDFESEEDTTPSPLTACIYASVWNLDTRVVLCEMFRCGRNAMTPVGMRNSLIDRCVIHDIGGTSNFVGIDLEGKSYYGGELTVSNSMIYNVIKASMSFGYGEKVTVTNCISGGIGVLAEEFEVSNSTLWGNLDIKAHTPVNTTNRKNVVRNCKILTRGSSKYCAFNTVFENCLIEADCAKMSGSYASATMNVLKNHYTNCIIKGSLMPGQYSYCEIQRSTYADSPKFHGSTLFATNSYVYKEDGWFRTRS